MVDANVAVMDDKQTLTETVSPKIPIRDDGEPKADTTKTSGKRNFEIDFDNGSERGYEDGGDENSQGDGNDDFGSGGDEKDWDKYIKSIPMVHGYRKVNFEKFKNYYGDFTRHTIDALVVGPNTSHEIREETMRRGMFRTGEKASIESPDAWIQRVRIHSKAVLLHLENAARVGEDWDRTFPRTFFRPFRAFICSQPRMRQALLVLEEKWGEAERLEFQGLASDYTNDSPKEKGYAKEKMETGTSASKPILDSLKDDNFADGDEEEYNEVKFSGDSMDSIDALRHMRSYVDFVDKEILPLYHTFETPSKIKVRFNDLWYLFRAGETVYSADTDVVKSKRSASRSPTYQTIWRVYSTYLDPVLDGKPDDIGKSKRVFVVNCYYIDFDGESYGAVKHSLNIKYFEGERDIARLNMIPIRFMEGADAFIDRLREQGRRFQNYIKIRHLAYQGWNLISTPTGEAIGDKSHLEHIDSNVIVDFAEGFQHFSSHKPVFNAVSDDESGWRRGDDELPICHWTDASRTKSVLEVVEDIQLSEGIADTIRPLKMKSKIATIGEDDLILLPRRLVAYVLRERRFAMLDIDSFSPIKQQKNIFSSLKINPKHKRLVKSLTRAHFMKQEALKRGANLSMNQDIVRGKGLGLTILLHGVPGVGKTATAEAVAQTSGKPLFVITCGDLGITPTAVEESLSGIFRLAHLWDCVLLLDEADIFLSKRDTSNLQRNALVSVFLRVLEYYSGILFLTTNRVGTLDEAFKSRIHVSLYYEPLKRQQTLAIFQVNITKLIEIENERRGTLQEMDLSEPALTIHSESILDYAAWYYDSHPSNRWNGRQIRNAFQVASSLASYDMHKAAIEDDDDEDDEDENPVYRGHNPLDPYSSPSMLSWKQFDLVADTIRRFSTYMNETTNGTPEDIARVDGIRADDPSYKNSLKAPTSKYVPPEFRQQSKSPSSMLHGGTGARNNVPFHGNLIPHTPFDQRGLGRGRRGGFQQFQQVIDPNTYHARGSSGSPGVTENSRTRGFENHSYEESGQYFGSGGDFQERTNSRYEGHSYGHDAAHEDDYE
ncbi:aaa family ATPase [Grosmannia clavigera kw1407]|uniref:Aaa family ATPase n=1 Tax=Grosmannia clavigera (strain kw1407 / UAMH 11150) TaxID=655863 RepID=F0XPA6_GROCL|nr:aaa family ATPase [Grosmannia clavigera kw1407]EFX00278.1 aaa family ATPase [Grosmannia clavigera kw1407]